MLPLSYWAVQRNWVVGHYFASHVTFFGTCLTVSLLANLAFPLPRRPGF